MFRLLAVTLLLLQPLTAWAQTRDIVTSNGSERRVALVIGNKDYVEAPLKNPINDARAMAAALRERGFDVVTAENATKAQMEDAILRFGEKLTAGAIGLVYYSGHGMQVGGKNYLIPVDARITTEQSVPLRTIDSDAVLGQMMAVRTRVNLVILDACRNNPFERKFRSGGAGLAQMSAPEGTMIAYATAPGKVASDGDDTYGLYTQELLKAMKRPGLAVEQMFKQVRAEVARVSNGAQVPWESSSLTGDFYFTPGASAPPSANFQLDDLRNAEIRSQWERWQAAMRQAFEQTSAFQGGAEAKRQAWDRFLAAYAQDNPYSTEDETLRAQAQRLRTQAGDVAVVPPPAPRPPQETRPSGKMIVLKGRYPEPGTEFQDCPDCPVMVVVPAGSFTMGSPPSEPGRYDNEGPQRRVTISRPFAVGKYEVTQAEWRSLMKNMPSRMMSGDRYPVETISWTAAQEFIGRLNQKLGGSLSVSTTSKQPYRMLTEAEWEYAARAGTTSPFWWGDSADQSCAYANGMDQTGKDDQPHWKVAVSCRDGHVDTAPVGSFRANAFGLHDMAGNVWEWVQDCQSDYAGAPTDGSAAIGAENCKKTIRGGSFNYDPRVLRSAARSFYAQDQQNLWYVGLRLAREIPEQEATRGGDVAMVTPPTAPRPPKEVAPPAQTGSSSPITILVGGNQRTLVDRLARSLARHLAHELGRPVRVENYPDEDGMVAARKVTEAKPDGRTLLFAGEERLARAAKATGMNLGDIPVLLSIATGPRTQTGTQIATIFSPKNLDPAARRQLVAALATVKAEPDLVMDYLGERFAMTGTLPYRDPPDTGKLIEISQKLSPAGRAQAEGLFGDARADRAAGRCDAAIAKFERALAIHPADGDAHFELADCYLRAKDRIRALDHHNIASALELTAPNFLGHWLQTATLQREFAREAAPSPLKILVGAAAGSQTDILARALAQELGRAIGADVTVENSPAAASVLKRAKPDGSTLVFGELMTLHEHGQASGVELPEVFSVLADVAKGQEQGQRGKFFVLLAPKKIDRHAWSRLASAAWVALSSKDLVSVYAREKLEVIAAISKPDDANVEEMKRISSKLSQEARNKAASLIQQGSRDYGAGRTRDAIQKFAQGLAINPAEPDAHFFLAQAFLKENDRLRAYAHYSLAIELGITGPNAAEAKKKEAELW